MPAAATQALPVTSDTEAPGETRTGAYVVLLFVMLAALAVLLFLFGKSVGLFGTSSAALVEVPSVLTKPADEATKLLKDAGFDPKIEYAANEDYPQGIVFGQDPGAGSKAKKGAEVKIQVSQGAAPVEVPDVVGQNINDAADALRAAGFDPQEQPQSDDKIPAGEVISQTPPGKSKAPRGSQVLLTVSSGKEKVAVPNVVGDDADAAFAEIGRAGLNPTRVNEPSSDVPEGKVIRTNPPAGTQVEKDSNVDVVVSTGPEDVVVPDVVGMKQADAEKKLKDKGFKVTVQTVASSNPDEDGRVVDQDPNAGDKQPAGSTVTITVAQLSP
jgi:serine/threonine-protein kinase